MLVITVKGLRKDFKYTEVVSFDGNNASKELKFEEVDGINCVIVNGDKITWEIPVSDILKIEEKPDNYILRNHD